MNLKINNPILIGLLENNIMRDLTNNEVKEVNGGKPALVLSYRVHEFLVNLFS
jgi:hypothetical protein